MTRYVAVMLIFLTMNTFVFAGQDTKEAGKEVGKGLKEAGKEFKKAGKEIGHGFKELGKDTAKAFKEMGEGIKEGVNDKK